MIYDLIISEPAEDDMTDIGMYITQTLHSPVAALNLLDEIDKQIISLEQMPKRYALVSDERLAKLGIRSIPVNNYLIFYTVDEYMQSVTIIRILYGKRDWANLL